MSCCGVKHSKQQSKGITEMSCYIHFERVYCTLGRGLKKGMKSEILGFT